MMLGTELGSLYPLSYLPNLSIKFKKRKGIQNLGLAL